MFFTFSLRILTEAVKNLTLPTLQTFHITKAESLSNRWTKYVKRFDISCSAITVTDPKQKLSMFLTFMGKDMWNSYVSIVTNNDTSFDDVVATFNDPFVSTVYESSLFRQMRQQPNKTIHKFYIWLKHQGCKCDFHYSEWEIKQLELSTMNIKLQRY